MQTPSIRKARRKDRYEMQLCNERNLQENYPDYMWENLLTDNPGKSYVLELNSFQPNASVVGYICVNNSIIVSFAIDKPYRSQGYGKQLLDMVLNNKEISRPLTLQVRVSNEPAIKLYKSKGFTESKELKYYYQNPNEDGIEMICV